MIFLWVSFNLVIQQLSVLFCNCVFTLSYTVVFVTFPHQKYKHLISFYKYNQTKHWLDRKPTKGNSIPIFHTGLGLNYQEATKVAFFPLPKFIGMRLREIITMQFTWRRSWQDRKFQRRESWGNFILIIFLATYITYLYIIYYYIYCLFYLIIY